MIKEIDKLRKLIAENKMDRALQAIKENIAAYPDLQNQLLTLSAKFNDVRKKENMGMLDEGESSKLYSQVNYSVLELLNEIETTNASNAPAEIPVAPSEPEIPSRSIHGSWLSPHGKDPSSNGNENDIPAEPANIRAVFSASPANEAVAATGVFISYNHNDMDVANKLKVKLKAENINVVIDSERMQAGEDIK